MNKLPIAISPIIKVDNSAATPLSKQIYDAFRGEILCGNLRPGQQVPSSRELVTEVAASRFPILDAYAQLKADGYFESRAGVGTFVSSSLPDRVAAAVKQVSQRVPVAIGPRPVARRARLYPAFDRTHSLRGWGAFGVHQPTLQEFPFQIWSSLVARHSRNPNVHSIHCVDPLGSERFREAVCSYLRTARGVKCNPGQIMVVSGSQQALDITVRVLFNPGNPVLVEEPGCYLTRALLTAAGCSLISVPVDDEGMIISRDEKMYRSARAAVVTPSHQFPLGATMSASRRIDLLNWAQSTGAWIIEDDYGSEYRYESEAVQSLQGLDASSRVIYIGTFSKVLFPSLRIGYVVIPPDLVERFVAVRATMDVSPPYLYQEVLADFMSMRHFGRHIRRMRQIYRERCTMLVESLEKELGDTLEVHGVAAGMHLAVTLPEGFSDREIAAKAAAERLWLWPLSRTYLGKKPRQGFILGFGSTATNQIPDAVRLLREVIHG